MKRRIVLLGPPASGKGTQADMIAAAFGIPAASPGAILREEKRRGSKLGIEADELTSQGKLVPDEIVCSVVREWLTLHAQAFVFDGFPRSRGQADALEEMLAALNVSLDVVISLEVDYETIARRVQNRLVCSVCRANFSIGLHVSGEEQSCPKCGGSLSRRDDDTMATLQLRMREYAEKTQPLIAYYDARHLLRPVDSMRAPDVVFQSIVSILEGE